MDPWNTQYAKSDVVTVRICRALKVLLKPEVELTDSNDATVTYARKRLNMTRALYRQITSASLNERGKLETGPVKIGPFHDLIIDMGFELSHVYQVATQSTDLRQMVASLQAVKSANEPVVQLISADQGAIRRAG